MSFIDGIFQYQANTASNTKTLGQVKGAGRILSVQGQELVPGKVFEGTVTEMKNGQVTLGLSDGKTISARMEQGVSLAKGQPMLFEVKSNTGEQIAIRPVVLESAQNPTLMKALEAAGLKANPRNLSMVNQMMMEQLPIDKGSLMQMARAVGNFPHADMQTLVQMQKLGFPIDENALNQFQNYKNGQQAMLPDMLSLMEGLAELSEQAFGKEGIGQGPNSLENIMLFPDGQGQAGAGQGQGTGASQVLGFQQQLLEILLGGNSTAQGPESLLQEGGGQQAGTVPDAVLLGQSREGVLDAGIGNQSGEAVLNAGLNQPGEGVLDAGNGSQVSGQESTAGNGGQSGEAVLNTGNGSQAGEAVLNIGNGGQPGEAVLNAGIGNQAGEAVSNAEAGSQVTGQESAAVNGGNGSQAGEALSSINKTLSQEQQTSLAKLLQEIPGARDNGQLLPNGRLNASLSAGELLQQIMASVEHTENLDGGILKKLFASKEYKGLLKQAIADRWFLSPENLKEEGAVKELYQRMSRQLEQIQQALSQAGKEGAALSKHAQSLQSNIEFMNQMNQAYTYAQLPLKLRGQNAHSDLYVYTNKKSLHEKGGELSALLHLDLDHLGSTDIFVKLKGTAVQADFYLENDASYRLIFGNTGQLVERLQERGYQCEVKVENRPRQQDFVEDFLEHDKPSGKLHRYSFDVKA